MVAPTLGKDVPYGQQELERRRRAEPDLMSVMPGVAKRDAAGVPDDPVPVRQLNVRIPEVLYENLGFVAKVTGESTTEIVIDALHQAVDERLSRPEVRKVLQDLLARATPAA